MARAAVRLVVRGAVQGVGYRWWTTRQARFLGLDGWVRNRRDGSVEILAIGPETALASLEKACRSGPSAALVRGLERAPAEDDGSVGFKDRPTV
ncbi:MAG TPA: acylphosphatase [Caulobacteraceae bacterium]|nr:acylphosphatase [Caulobacteraceae bacterium]